MVRGLLPVRKIPTTVEEFPRNLKRDERLARAGGEREQDARLIRGDGLQHALNGDVLIVAARMRTALVLKRHGGEAVTPGVRFGEGQVPEFFRAGITRDVALRARDHVYAIDGLTVGGISKAST